MVEAGTKKHSRFKVHFRSHVYTYARELGGKFTFIGLKFLKSNPSWI